MAIDRSFFPSPHRVSMRLRSLPVPIFPGLSWWRKMRRQFQMPGPATFVPDGKDEESLIAGISGAVVITTQAMAERLSEVVLCWFAAIPVLLAQALALMVAEIGACHPPQQAAPIDGVTVGNNVSIGEQVSIGKGTIIEPGAVIHQGVEIGRNCRIEANAVLSHCRLGNHVRIGANSVIGGSGFGFGSHRMDLCCCRMSARSRSAKVVEPGRDARSTAARSASRISVSRS